MGWLLWGLGGWLCVWLFVWLGAFLAWLGLRSVGRWYAALRGQRRCARRALVAARGDAPAPSVHSRRKPEWVVHEVLRLKVLMGNTGCRTVAHTFNQLHGHRQLTVGKTYVAQCIRANQYALACLRAEMRAKRPADVVVNAVWAMDLTFYGDAQGEQQIALGVLDHGSRLVTGLHTLLNKRSWTLLGHLCLAIGRYGKPRRIRTDSEVIFTSFVFTTFLKLVGIGHQRIKTCAPWQNGRMERLFGTLKPLLRQLVIPTRAALQAALDEFTLFYNHVRPHQNLGGLTPAQKCNGLSSVDLRQTPPKRSVLVQALDGLLVGYYTRR